MAWPIPRVLIQVVFAVQGRQNLIRPERKEELQKYITGIVTRQGQKLIAIHCMPDHTHLLIGLKPNLSLSQLVGDIKTGSTNHINENRWVVGRFAWQEGFGAFFYSHSQLGDVIHYIQDQEKHHARKSFREEYLEFLKKFDVAHDEKYIFKAVEEDSFVPSSVQKVDGRSPPKLQRSAMFIDDSDKNPPSSSGATWNRFPFDWLIMRNTLIRKHVSPRAWPAL